MLRTLLLSLGLLLAGPLAAQDAAPATFAEGALLDRAEALDAARALVDPADRAALDAFDPDRLGHVGLVRQEGTGHAAALHQLGPANLAALYQRGADQSALVEQVGAGNVLGLRLDGDGHAVTARQLGDGNLYLLDADGPAGGPAFDHAVLQVGDDLQAIQTGVTAAPFDVEQRGTGMSLIIRH